MVTQTRDDMLAALQQPAAYPHAAESIAHHSTHISDVFLAGEYAYKLKKPVDFGFLDFTTLDRRRRACEDEVRLNARLAPDIYLGVSQVCDGDGVHVRPDGCRPGESLLDVAVQMHRLPEDGLFDRLAQRGELTRELLVDVADQIAALHTRTGRNPALAHFATVEAIRAPVQQNFDQTAAFAGAVVPDADFEALRDWQLGFLAQHATHFSQRIESGRIVDGHGDLHLRNLCRVDDRAVIFDCLEFNAALRAGDAINDIAFLIMDLDYRGLSTLGAAFLNHYLMLTDDYAGLPLLDFYLSYRAMVRAKVMCLEMDATPDPAHVAAARRYVELALRYARPRRPALIITCGVSGSGKSTAGLALAERVGAVMIRSDAVRKHLAGVSLATRDRRGTDAGIYAPDMSARTYERLLAHARAVIASGRVTILDATWLQKRHRAPAAALARELGVPFGILYCEAPRDELAARLDRREQLDQDVSDATVAILDRQLAEIEPPTIEEGALCSLDDDAARQRWLESLVAS